MKKTIIALSILAVFLLLNIPSIPAENINVVQEANKSQLLGKINMEQLKEKINGLVGQTDGNPPAQPTCLGLLYLLILYLIIFAIKITFKAIFSSISALITKIVIIISTIIGFISGGASKVIDLIVTVVQTILSILGQISGWTGETITALITILITIIGLIIQGIHNKFQNLFNAIAGLIRFILDVLNLIYAIIFPGSPALQTT